MKYGVVIAAQAEQEIGEQTEYIARDKPLAAKNWLVKLYAAIEELEAFPRRHPVAEELSATLGFELRRMVVGNYLIFYRVDEARGVVEVLRFRHGARRIEGEENPPTD